MAIQETRRQFLRTAALAGGGTLAAATGVTALAERLSPTFRSLEALPPREGYLSPSTLSGKLSELVVKYPYEGNQTHPNQADQSRITEAIQFLDQSFEADTSIGKQWSGSTTLPTGEWVAYTDLQENSIRSIDNLQYAYGVFPFVSSDPNTLFPLDKGWGIYRISVPESANIAIPTPGRAVRLSQNFVPNRELPASASAITQQIKNLSLQDAINYVKNIHDANPASGTNVTNVSLRKGQWLVAGDLFPDEAVGVLNATGFLVYNNNRVFPSGVIRISVLNEKNIGLGPNQTAIYLGGPTANVFLPVSPK